MFSAYSEVLEGSRCLVRSYVPKTLNSPAPQGFRVTWEEHAWVRYWCIGPGLGTVANATSIATVGFSIALHVRRVQHVRVRNCFYCCLFLSIVRKYLVACRLVSLLSSPHF